MSAQPAPVPTQRLGRVAAFAPPAKGRVLVGPWPQLPAKPRPARPAPGRLQRLRQALSSWIQDQVRSWAYSAAADSRRDLRVDLLRGFCVFAMVADHLGGESWLYGLTGGNRSTVSAAEGFIFISGLVVGQVYFAKIDRLGLPRAVLQVLRRARTLYLVTTVMTLIFSGLRLYTDLALWVPRGLSPGVQSLPELFLATVTLHNTYHGTDILAMYVFCMLAAAGGLALLSVGRWRWVLAASWLVWLGFQVRPEELRLPWYIHNSENFPLAAWQVLFIAGLVIGFHRKRLSDWFARRLHVRNALVGLAIVLTFGVAWSFQIFGDTAPDLFAKVSVGPVRLVGFAGVAVIAYAVTTVAWEPLRRLTGWLLLPLGQHALYCYVAHFFLILLILNVLPGGQAPTSEADWLSPTAIGTALQLALVFGLWALTRRRILFGVVPN